MEGMRFRSLALAAAILVAAMLAACGDSGDSDSGDGGQRAADVANGPVDGGPDGDAGDAKDAGDPEAEREIRALYAELADAFYGNDPEGLCSLLTKSAQQQLGALSEPPTTCVNRAREIIEQNQKGSPGGGRPRIVSLTVNGDRARALAKAPRTLRYPVPFVKVDGTWKVDGGFTSGI